jgi:hypothetical protein
LLILKIILTAFFIAVSTGDAGEKSTAPRMDLAVLIENSKGASVVFCEAKCADNVELWKPAEKKNLAEEPHVAVVSQIRKYETFIGDPDNNEGLIDAYVCVCQTLIHLRKHGLDPLVEGVAANRKAANWIPLTIHPHVYLLVYGYGKDEKNGVLGNRLETLRHKENLGDRLIAKGKADQFTLSHDILRQAKVVG